ncbi:hypothetical protein EDC01DRAFT_732337 [Geopyxis carbonaria]|nr:hypothetical protein EDC01DRAFT_732337 [Geopyxis carbonaria]
MVTAGLITTSVNAGHASYPNLREEVERDPVFNLRRSRSAGHNILRTSSSNEAPTHSPPRPMSSAGSSPRHSPNTSIIIAALQKSTFNFNGISLDCFTYPSDLRELSPFEERGSFKNKKHSKRYKAMKAALETARKKLTLKHQAEARLRPSIMRKRRDVVAARFHFEFCMRVSWGDHPQPSNGPIRKQIPDSVFSSINTYLIHYPRLSIAWAVNDFYMQLDKALQDSEAIMDLKNVWEWGELHYLFFRAVSRLREQYGMQQGAMPRWYTFFSGNKIRVNTSLTRDYEISQLVKEEWSPQMDKKRRYQQFCAFQKIRDYFDSKASHFPTPICPGGLTMVEYFNPNGFPEDPKTDQEARNMFCTQPLAEIYENSELWGKVTKDTQELLSCRSPEDYFSTYPTAGRDIRLDQFQDLGPSAPGSHPIEPRRGSIPNEPHSSLNPTEARSGSNPIEPRSGSTQNEPRSTDTQIPAAVNGGNPVHESLPPLEFETPASEPRPRFVQDASPPVPRIMADLSETSEIMSEAFRSHRASNYYGYLDIEADVIECRQVGPWDYVHKGIWNAGT